MSQSSEMATTSQKKFPYIDVLEEKVSGTMFLDKELNPMYFVICIRDYELKSELKNFIEFCGGEINDSVQEMNPYAVVLVADNCLCWSYNGDVFRLSYIESCFNARSCLDISDFRRNSESNVKPGFCYMNIIYYKKYPWNEIPSEFLKGPSTNPSKGNRNYTVTQESEDSSSSNEIDPNIRDTDNLNKQKGPSTNPSKGNRNYTVTQESEDSSSSNEIDPNIRDTDNLNKQKGPSTNPSKGNRNYTVTEESEDSSSSYEIEPNIRNTDNRNKHTRLPYSLTEKIAILKYITTNQEYDRIKGTLLWKIMERAQVCKVRTWQSMREHFMKKIMSELSNYKFLTPDQLKKLKYNYVK